ncbi:MAG: glycosyltransferase family 4 protein [Acidobacteria bacterium]|nr:glycosyltransferase family 4 protein [Acidobacteriota bacterium]
MTSRPARILEITSYPPPRAGWGIRVEFLKKRMEREGHSCVVLNIGTSRAIPSPEYETVLGGRDFLAKVWRFSQQGYVIHAHANGDALKGLALALIAEVVGLVHGRRCFLTFHAGVIQRYFPRHRAWWLAPVFWLLFIIPKRIICNSEPVKACIRGYGVSGRKIVPIAAFSSQYLEFTPRELPSHLTAFLTHYPHIVFTYMRMRTLFYPVTMIEGMARLMARRGDVGLVLCGGRGHSDEGMGEAVDAAIRRHGVADRICQVDDLDHDAFLTVLQRSTLYLRTPITDGVASSVLESMALGVPVVACENGTRPRGVVTYQAEDAAGLADAVEHTIDNRAAVAAAMAQFEVPDTLADEIALLTS